MLCSVNAIKHLEHYQSFHYAHAGFMKQQTKQMGLMCAMCSTNYKGTTLFKPLFNFFNLLILFIKIKEFAFIICSVHISLTKTETKYFKNRWRVLLSQKKNVFVVH